MILWGNVKTAIFDLKKKKKKKEPRNNKGKESRSLSYTSNLDYPYFECLMVDFDHLIDVLKFIT